MNKDKLFHDLSATPFVEREAFNSAILLLTMVRSEHYYITGFSRTDNYIQLAFDYESQLHSRITEQLRLELSRSPEYALLGCQIANLTPEAFDEEIAAQCIKRGSVTLSQQGVYYEIRLEKDEVLPLGAAQINALILTARDEICRMLEGCYLEYLGIGQV